MEEETLPARCLCGNEGVNIHGTNDFCLFGAWSDRRLHRQSNPHRLSRCFIRACDTDPATLKLALAEGTADEVTDHIGEDNGASFTSCDFLFLCAPVSQNDSNLLLIRSFLLNAEENGCILTDVGSVKTTIHEHIEQLGLTSCFIGGHPMAGSERIGYQNSKASLLENAYYILTPTRDVPRRQLEATPRW